MPVAVGAQSRPSAPAVSRRRVVQGAAWTAPAIVLAGAAPAFAGTGVNLDIVDFTAGRALTVPFFQLKVRNNALVTYTGGITVTVTVTSGGSGNASAPSIDLLSGTGWTQDTVTESPTGFTAVYARAPASLAAGTDTPNLRVNFTSANGLTPTGGSITAQVTTPSSPNNGVGSAMYSAL
jgi:hypothetical protein